MATSVKGDDRPTGTLGERFAALWEGRGGEPPDLSGFLRGYPEASPSERLAVVLIDQGARWRAGLGRPVAEYLANFPDLATDPALAEALERGERTARGERVARVEATQDVGTAPPLNETPDLGWWPGEGPSPGLMVTMVEGVGGPGGGEQTLSGSGRTRATYDSPTMKGDDSESSLAFQLNTLAATEPGSSDPSAVPRHGSRFTIDHRLGTGGMGVVYQAYDHDRDEPVALKTMRRIDPLALYRFKQEFRSLADLSHPNLVNLYELIALGEVWFFTMELVPGVDFIRHVRARPGVAPGDPVSTPGPPGPELEARLRPAVRQLAEGVAALHDAGKLHRDIKPPNVLVTDGGRVVLLDFGLTADLGRSGLLSLVGERVVGTVGYMSPEQALGQALSAASDWYSVGVMLYEALTGVLPIGGSPEDVLADKLRIDPPPPVDVAPWVPADLNALCVDLLRRDPAARPSGAEVLARLSADPPPARPGPARGDRPAAIPLIGRERHIEALNAALTEVKAGHPVVMFVSGRPGSGKSALLQSFLGELPDEDGAVVLSGRCYERESVPFKALDSVVDELSRYLTTLPADEVRALLPRDVALLARMFPVLQRVEGVAAAPGAGAEAADQQEIRRRAVAALRELLAAIGRDRPLVLAIDDLQWGDPENAELIDELVRPPGAPVMLLIGSYRTDAAEDSPLVRELLRSGVGGPRRRELAVGALTNVESRELALALLGRNDPVARAEAHVVARESQGNPFFIDELAKHIQAGGGLSGRGASADRLSLVEVIWGRVNRLPDEARRLLEVVAVSGRPVSLHDACQAAGLGVGGRAAAAALRVGRLVRGTIRPNRDEVETYHDWVRETVVAHLPAEVAAGYHLRLAQVLEAGGRADAETLAVHYQGGGWTDRAAENYARAAEKSVTTLAFSHAAALYRLALRLRPGRAGDAEAVRLRTRLADALADAGRGHEAAIEYLDTSASAAAADALELKRRAALQFLISGHVDDGFGLLRTVLDARGMSMPSSPTGALLALVRRRAWLRVRGLDFTARDATQVSAELLSLIDLCWSAGAGLSLIDPVRGADFQTRGLLLALKAGEPYRVARALTLEASTVSLGGRTAAARAAALLARAEDVARPLDHPHLDGLLALSRGVSALMLGRWKDACRWFARSEPLLRDRCTGVTWELDTVHNLWLWALTFLGDLPELRRRWQAFLKEARERGDLYAVTTMNTYYMALLRLADDEPARALAETDGVMARWSRQGYHLQHASALRARATVALYRGEAKAAWGMVRDEWPRYRRSLLPRVQWLRVQMTELRARCALAASDSSPNPGALLRGAERDARALKRERVNWASAHASLIRAGVVDRRGDRLGATALLHVAITGYDDSGMRLHACACRRSAGQLLAGEPGHALVTQADDALAAQGVRKPAAFAAVIAPWFSDESGKTSTSFGRSSDTSPGF